ncbi:hypothetical protein SAY87_024911 [Trapa incisa]|uniref:Uncharacterized protein n=1 Tax=Trapa incisa TaxID=236973 RepID=A0AAN7JGA7_9MYRT|nr:hypothetical protein SAY87_024911 [Trapa incisa]
MDRKKLLINERVEVRQFEEGLRGSWHPAVVIGISKLSRTVKYDELLDDQGNSRLIESIPITGAIEGLHKRRHVSLTYRGHIRPQTSILNPQPSDVKLKFGVCVDAFFQDAWWEGVIFDAQEDAMERSVYFPDEGDERKFNLSNLRPSRVWDEFSGEWADCGVWIFLELVRELNGSMPSSTFAKVLWLRLQSNYCFKKMISEWNCGTRTLWKKYLKDVVCERKIKLGKMDPTVKKLVGSKRKKMHELDNSQAEPRSSDAVVQLNSSRGLRNAELSENGGVSVLNKSRARTFSVPLRLNVRRTSRPVVSTAGTKLILSETLSMEENVAGYEKFPTDMISEEEYSKTNKTSCSVNDNRINRVTVPIRQGHYRKVKDREDKLNFSRSCQDGNKAKGLQPREDIVEDANCSLEISQSIGKDEVKNLMKQRRNFSMNSSECTQNNTRARASVVASAKRKTSCTRRNIPKGICKSDANINPTLLQEDVNSLQSKQNLSTRQRRQSMMYDCYVRNFRLKDMVSRPRRRKRKRHTTFQQSDTICFICHYGGELISCKNCSSSYHSDCIGTQVLPDENWFCTSCCCALCGSRDSIGDTDEWSKACFQCSRSYHVDCLSKLGHQISNCRMDAFCSDSCYKLFLHLHGLLGASKPTSVNGLTWTMVRSMRRDCRNWGLTRKANFVKLSHALKVIQESFQPIIELHTKRDLVKDVVYSSVSKLKRLNFEGFYVMVLQKGDEVVSAATVRVHGQKVAEMPLIATDFDYRKQGMCRLLVHELIKLLVEMGIERLVLPAASQVRTMWETSFGFSEMRLSDRLELRGYPLLGFQGTTMIQKFLGSSCRIKTRYSCR